MNKKLVERIDKLSANQVSRSIELLMPRLANQFKGDIMKETAQLVEKPDLNQASYLLVETFKAQKCLTSEETIRAVVEDEQSRVKVARNMLLILASMPETSPIVDKVVSSAENEMFVAEILAVGVAATMMLLGSSVVISVCRMKQKDLPAAVRKICGAISIGFSRIGAKLDMKTKKGRARADDKKPADKTKAGKKPSASTKVSKKPSASKTRKIP